MFLAWDSSYEIGIHAIDEQHKRIVDYINMLDNAVHSKDMTNLPYVIDQLIDYTVAHFSFEESLMARHNYSHFEAHCRVHEMFKDRIQLYKNDLAAGKDVSRKLLAELKVWLVSHIKHEDRDYVEEIRHDVDEGWVSRTLGRFFKSKSEPMDRHL